MSTFESVIWHILGYTAMPMIILSGFVAVAAICIWLLSLGKDKNVNS
ncbi:TIGR02808 family protein [Vibrio sagamiensis]|uniref:TIGR02808 family protein n=1 Tax=Vibrio sagamiensis NBRC 104589 TaxID=1219064 RepID=A0A511QFU2_9VIBR|nr:TIGR02808 family protein [Vibrio sagamiensis]PNQ56760.1 TIGR02808 family protein [Vibrio agarivorans]GEM76178.1 TIGR02808 family protein [Vibrio sagamiensis NBRC 104589]